jgi:hypothetical protein
LQICLFIVLKQLFILIVEFFFLLKLCVYIFKFVVIFFLHFPFFRFSLIKCLFSFIKSILRFATGLGHLQNVGRMLNWTTGACSHEFFTFEFDVIFKLFFVLKTLFLTACRAHKPAVVRNMLFCILVANRIFTVIAIKFRFH